MEKLIRQVPIDSIAVLNEDEPTTLRFLRRFDCVSEMAGQTEPTRTNRNQLMWADWDEIERKVPWRVSLFADDWKGCNWLVGCILVALVGRLLIRSSAISFGRDRFRLRWRRFNHPFQSSAAYSFTDFGQFDWQLQGQIDRGFHRQLQRLFHRQWWSRVSGDHLRLDRSC